jgi:hypothetical protein
MARTAAQRALYAARLAAGFCPDCGADLKPLLAWGKPRCPESYEKLVARARRYNASPNGKARSTRYMARTYAERRAAGACIDCGAPAVVGKARCEPHLAAHREWGALYLDRQEQADANL